MRDFGLSGLVVWFFFWLLWPIEQVAQWLVICLAYSKAGNSLIMVCGYSGIPLFIAVFLLLPKSCPVDPCAGQDLRLETARTSLTPAILLRCLA